MVKETGCVLAQGDTRLSSKRGCLWGEPPWELALLRPVPTCGVQNLPPSLPRPPSSRRNGGVDGAPTKGSQKDAGWSLQEARPMPHALSPCSLDGDQLTR